MFKKYPINSYYRVSMDEVLKNLSPEFKAHLRCLFNCSNLDSVKIEFGQNESVIFHFQSEV